MIEGFWHVLKDHCLPHEAPADDALLQTYAWSLVYREWCVGDPVEDLGRAVRFYMEAHMYDNVWPHEKVKAPQENKKDE